MLKQMPSGVDFMTDASSIKAANRASHLADLQAKGEAPIRLHVDAIDPSPYQPRISFDQVEAMAESLREGGQDYPVLVRKVGDRYEVADGETRVRAIRLNFELHGGDGLVDAVIRDYTDEDMALIAFRTAYQRKALSPLEEARGLKRLTEQFNISFDALGKRLGKDKAFVWNRVRLLNLPEDVQARLDGPTPIKAGHAVALGGISDEGARRQLVELAVADELSVAEINRRKDVLERVVAAEAIAPEKREALVAEALGGKVSAEDVERKVAKALAKAAPAPVVGEPDTFKRLKAAWARLTPEQQAELAAIAEGMVVA